MTVVTASDRVGVDPGDLLETAPHQPAPSAWGALGTWVRLATNPAHAQPEAVRWATTVLDEVDRACSRFRPDSDLVRANACAGRAIRVSPLLAAAVQVAKEAAEQTDGLVDPTLGHALVALGYDRDLALLPAASREPAGVPRPARRGAWREVEVDLDGWVRVPADCALDLGATGKAWASDLVARVVAERTGADIVVSLGGDVAVRGTTAWPVEVRERLVPGTGDDGVLVLLEAGGLATSTTLGRRWVRGGRTRHHLVDPRTGEPAEGPWRTVSALGHNATAANTASTAALVMGEDAWAWLCGRDVAARLVDLEGRVAVTPAWARAVGV